MLIGWRMDGVPLIATLALSTVIVSCNQPSATPNEGATPQSGSIVGVASVIDGDTIEIHGERIRLSGYDTPERNARCGDTNVYQQASLALADFVAERTVSCIPLETDRYERTVATCSASGVDLGEYMVGQGWGRDWPRYSSGAYADEEAQARRDSRGLWGLECPADLWGGRDYSPR